MRRQVRSAVGLAVVALLFAVAGCGARQPSRETQPIAPAPPAAAPSVTAPAAPPPDLPSAQPPGERAPAGEAGKPGAIPGPAATPAQTPPFPSTPPRHPIGVRIKAELERAGLTVYQVDLLAPQAGIDEVLVAITAAVYARPSTRAVLQQAYVIWDVLLRAAREIQVARDEDGLPLLVAGQVWTKYLLLIDTPGGYFSVFAERVRRAAAPAEQQEELAAFLRNVRFRVVDLETNQFVEEKSFVDKHFIAD